MNRTDDSYFYSRVYREFIDIEQDEFRDIIRFFESNTTKINRLAFKEYFELLYTYTQALFEIEAHHSFIKMANYLIELVIENNIKYYNGEDIFFNTLHRKAKAHYSLLEYDETIHILKELTKMNPNNRDVVKFLKECTYQKKSSLLKTTRIASVALFILTAALIAIELFLVRPYWEDHIKLIENSRNLLFLGGWIMLLGGELFHRSRTYYQISYFINTCKRKNR